MGDEANEILWTFEADVILSSQHFTQQQKNKRATFNPQRQKPSDFKRCYMIWKNTVDCSVTWWNGTRLLERRQSQILRVLHTKHLKIGENGPPCLQKITSNSQIRLLSYPRENLLICEIFFFRRHHHHNYFLLLQTAISLPEPLRHNFFSQNVCTFHGDVHGHQASSFLLCSPVDPCMLDIEWCQFLQTQQHSWGGVALAGARRVTHVWRHNN